MASDIQPTRSRRAILAAGLGGLAAFAANALGRPLPARAVNGDPILAGTAEDATAETRITSSATNSAAIAGVSSGGNYGVAGISGTGTIPAFATKTGLFGFADQDANARGAQGKSGVGTGVYGSSDSGRGVYGISTAGTGVSASSSTGRGVYATSSATDKAAMVGQSVGGSSGIQGMSGGGVPPAPRSGVGVEGIASAAGTGVYGLSGSATSAASDTSRTGVYGFSPTNSATVPAAGVWGDSVEGYGVFGSGDVGVWGDGGFGIAGTSGATGVGVFGRIVGSGTPPQAVQGTGVFAGATDLNQLALDVAGKAHFRRSGSTTVSAGTSSKVVSLAGVTGNSLIFAVLRNNKGGVWVRAVVPVANAFTIYLNVVTSTSVGVAYFVLD
jgi:hypothetical protein